MSKIAISLLLAIPVWSACGQSGKNENKADRVVGGSCEGCEAVNEYGSRILSSSDTLPDFNEQGPKLEVSGTIYRKDGKTTAGNVVMYVYHTNQAGIYPTRGDEKGWAKRNGYIRGWIRTNADGKYKFYTLRPGAYPGRQNPEHIHVLIKEEGLTSYYIDEFLFDDDPILTNETRQRQENRGGSGIVKVTRRGDGTQLVKRDIILGKNIPGY
jgi:protocatechuate 3,4-dioxygenase, beta subunit